MFFSELDFFTSESLPLLSIDIFFEFERFFPQPRVRAVAEPVPELEFELLFFFFNSLSLVYFIPLLFSFLRITKCIVDPFGFGSVS